MHFGARQEQPEGCPWPSVALESFYALFPLLPVPALWVPSSVPCQVVAPNAPLAVPLWQRRLSQPGCGAAPQGPPRGAPGDGDARSRAGVRWGRPAIAHALPRAAQPVSSLDTQRPAGPRVPTCAARIKRQATGRHGARWCGRAPGRAAMELDDAKFVVGFQSAPKVQDCGAHGAHLRVFCFSFSFLSHHFPAKSAIDLAIAPFFGDDATKHQK